MNAFVVQSPGESLVRVRGLCIAARSAPRRRLVDGIGFELRAGETLGILGESGSGKTLTLRSLIGGLMPWQFEVSGQLEVLGCELYSGHDPLPLQRLRGRSIAMVYQDPASALDPLYCVGAQMVEAIRAHRSVDAAVARALALHALEEVQFGEPERIYLAHAHQLSGGQKQRVAIAMALLHEPRVLLADEPTTALDVSIQAQVLRTLKALQTAHGMAIVLVTHDVSVVAEMADRVLVMRQGEVVEQGGVIDVLTQPRHEYTKALLGAKAEMLSGLALDA